MHWKSSARKVTLPNTIPALGDLISEYHGIQVKVLIHFTFKLNCSQRQLEFLQVMEPIGCASLQCPGHIHTG